MTRFTQFIFVGVSGFGKVPKFLGVFRPSVKRQVFAAIGYRYVNSPLSGGRTIVRARHGSRKSGGASPLPRLDSVAANLYDHGQSPKSSVD